MRTFITGVTGAGKSTLMYSLIDVHGSNTSTAINFDAHVDYSLDQKSRLNKIYDLIHSDTDFIIDALPFLEGDDFDKFLTYLKQTKDIPICLYVVYCPRNEWLNCRVLDKQSHLIKLGVTPPSLEEYEKMYDNFYNGIDHTIRLFSEYITDIKIYDSHSNLFLPYNSLIELTRKAT